MAFDLFDRLGRMFGKKEPETPVAEAAPAEVPPAEAVSEAPAAEAIPAAPEVTYTVEEVPAAPAAEAQVTAPEASTATDVAATTTEPTATAEAATTATTEPTSAPVAAEAPAAPAKSAEELEEERLWAETDAAWSAGDFQKVTESLDALRALQPEDAAVIDEKIAAAQFNQASALEQSGELDRALYLYQEAQRRNPNLGEAGFAVERVQAALQPPAPAAVAEPSPAEQTYTVESGDSLWAIAERFYGDGSQFSRIFEANRDQLDNPDVIQPGQVLRIPA